MNKKEIRWKQRFQNFKQALEGLKEAIELPHPNKWEKAGLVQFFEMSFELAWKTLKDHLEENGKIVHAPKEILKQSFQDELITDGTIWLKALEDRNLSTHLYDEAKANELDRAIRNDYLPLLTALYERLKKDL